MILASLSQRVWLKASNLERCGGGGGCCLQLLSPVCLTFSKNWLYIIIFLISKWAYLINGFLFNQISVTNFIHTWLPPTPTMNFNRYFDRYSKEEEFPPTSMYQLLGPLSAVGGHLTPMTSCKLHSLPKTKKQTFPSKKRNKSTFSLNSQDPKCSHNDHICTWVAIDSFIWPHLQLCHCFG